MAYSKKISHNTDDSHQSSPGYMLTFIRWSNRDTFNYDGDNLASRRPLVVINDAIQVTVSNTKTGITPSLNAIIKAGDINYATAVAPGDFVFCNMKNWATEIYDGNANAKLYGRAVNGQQINTYNDGFKGVFKVQTVRKTIVMDPESGKKTLAFRVNAFGFTEFNTNIYYDPLVFNEFQGNYKLFNAQFNNFWSSIVSGKNDFSIQNIMQLLIESLVGYGTKQLSAKLPNPANRHFRVPPVVGTLLGIRNAQFSYQIYNFLFGIWQSAPDNATTPGIGFNPSVTQESNPSFFKTPIALDGRRVLAAEYWNNVKIWNILQSYLNSVVNEMYTTYRVNRNNTVMPTLVARQKTFTSNHYRKGKSVGQSKSKINKAVRKEVSRHFEMPRWKIYPEMITDINLGRDEAARINFVQVYTRTLSANDQKNRAMQTGLGNYVVDVDDVERHGLKPYIVTAQFDFPSTGSKTNQPNKGAEWAQLVGDFLIGGHLREGGTLQLVGVEEPISVGDKLELDNTVYEIESVTHVMSVMPNGKKMFRTNLQVSFGMDLRSDNNRPVYPEMEDTDAHTKRVKDFNNNALMPGSSDTQDIPGRVNGEEIKETKQASFTLNPVKRQSNSNPSNRDTHVSEAKGGDLSIDKKGDN